jgi:hypothetical protein
MHRPRRRVTLATAAAAALLGGLAAAPANAQSSTPYDVVASGLNNPRHLGFTANGDLFVAESGTGGDGPCIASPEGGEACYGPTGSITEITRRHGHWRQQRVVTRLPSLAAPADVPAEGITKGSNAIGPSDVDVRGRRFVISIGLGANPSVRDEGAATAEPSSTEPATLPRGFGTLVTGKLRSHRAFLAAFRMGRDLHPRWHVFADIAAHEAATNPIDTPDSNPNSVLRIGSRYVVADAGGNTIVKANRAGDVKTIAAFEDTMVQVPGAPEGTLMPMQFVPTSVARNRHGDLFVSQLTGFPFPKGGASIWRLHEHGAPTKYATGLTNVTDLAFARDGSLYAVEISTEGLASGGPPIGALVRIPRGGGKATVVAGGLFAPFGVALRGHFAYVTTGSVLPGGGEVVRIPLH